ncbi:response regulator [Edaphobacter aggregans]|uniref:response regulator n=1 Tax=Edaphobacter aggregans TaxID=570835 RepID=UPI00068F7240|nr:response regulator transcription factor [Edaphobacter aggregans]
MAAQVVASPILVLVDDSPAFSVTVLEMLRTKYRVAAAFSDGTSALDKIGVLSPDIVILDISLGDLSGFEVARRLKLSKCPAKIIFLTMHEDTDFVSAARDVGASGYVFKSCLTVDLTKAIDTVFHGGRFQSGALSTKVR